MKISILTLFPSIFDGYFGESIMKRAIGAKLIEIEIVDIRDFATDKHRTCDDYAYGGGPGMVLKVEPLSMALQSVMGGSSTVVLPTPSGSKFEQSQARELSHHEHLVFVAGRYEGIDQRFIDRHVDLELCVGDYVLSSGELAAMVMIDATARLLKGFLSEESLSVESFEDGLLEYPHYTRPEEYDGDVVPAVLRSGHKQQIQDWREMKRVEKTAAVRPDLLARRI